MSIHFASDLDMSDDSRRRRTERDAQIATANTLVELLGEVQHIRHALDALNEGTALFSGGEERISSVTIEDMVKGPPKITSKSYAGRPLTRELVDQHLDAHAYAHREAERRSMNGWTETVAALSCTCKPPDWPKWNDAGDRMAHMPGCPFHMAAA